MSQPYVTGGCFFYVGLGPGRSPIYLGTCKQRPTIIHEPKYAPVFNDLTGEAIPYDLAYQGMTAFIQGVFNVYNNAVMEMLEQATFGSGLAGQTAGTDPAGSIGTLMVTERIAHPLWVVFPYAFKLPFNNAASGRMRRGYHYPECVLVGPTRHEGLGTVAKEEGLQWQALRGLGPTTSRGKPVILYDENLAGLPPPN